MGSRLMAFVGMVLSAVFACAALSATAVQDRPAREDYDSGAYLYRAFCASCHGETGKGDGPVADLAPTRPSDLTMLARNAGGVFPRAQALAVLESAKRVSGHDAPAMPNWQNVLRRTASDDERVVKRRLDALVSHIESMQAR